jgi:hypothetical protein
MLMTSSISASRTRNSGPCVEIGGGPEDWARLDEEKKNQLREVIQLGAGASGPNQVK